jgi:hypothetical protein
VALEDELDWLGRDVAVGDLLAEGSLFGSSSSVPGFTKLVLPLLEGAGVELELFQVCGAARIETGRAMANPAPKPIIKPSGLFFRLLLK